MNLESEVKYIIENDKGMMARIANINNFIPKKSPEQYECMDFSENGTEISLNWRIYADTIREFGILPYTEDMTISMEYSLQTHTTVKELIAQYGLRNVTNELAKQINEARRNLNL